MNTPDTEWEKIAVKLWNIALDEDNKNARQEFRDVLTQARTSRDAYWMERVRKEVEGLQERFGDWDNGDENEPLLLKCEVLGILDNLK
ncbi:MAG: hypothetical protein IPO40_24490 [Fibrobacteres bacterium]|nr:hypothetical protein [Fibrobacterota bacterium]